MKAYVTGYAPNPEHEQAERLGQPYPIEDFYLIQYERQPDHWKIPNKEVAELELRLVQGYRFHVGLHYCDFELEQVGEEYAIVCKSHPDF